MAAGDIPAAAALERLCFSTPWDEQLLAAALEQPAFRLWGVKDAQRLAGYVSIYHLAEEVEILNLAVAPEFRGQGVGKALLRQVCGYAEIQGVERIVLEVRVGNIPAVRLYERFGFRTAGRRKAYYPDNREDALIYVRDLERP